MDTPTGRPRTCDCGTCKKCKWRDYMRSWYAKKTPEERRAWVATKDKDKVRAFDRERNRQPERQAARRERNKAWREANPHKRLAHAQVYRAIAAGELSRQPCEVCGSAENIHAHHESYDRPLDVRWLCPIHHAAAHARGDV